MNTTKHIAGPWYFEAHNHPDHNDPHPHLGANIRAFDGGSDYWNVAKVYNYLGSSIDPERSSSLGTALLIRAAPDLLEAAEKAKSSLDAVLSCLPEEIVKQHFSDQVEASEQLAKVIELATTTKGILTNSDLSPPEEGESGQK